MKIRTRWGISLAFVRDRSCISCLRIYAYDDSIKIYYRRDKFFLDACDNFRTATNRISNRRSSTVEELLFGNPNYVTILIFFRRRCYYVKILVAYTRREEMLIRIRSRLALQI